MELVYWYGIREILKGIVYHKQLIFGFLHNECLWIPESWEVKRTFGSLTTQRDTHVPHYIIKIRAI